MKLLIDFSRRTFSLKKKEDLFDAVKGFCDE